MESRGGICRDRPRARKSGRRGDLAFGVVGKAWSSLLCGILSRKVGEGARPVGVVLLLAFGGSEKERDLEGVLEGEFASVGKCEEDRSNVVASIVVSRF